MRVHKNMFSHWTWGSRLIYNYRFCSSLSFEPILFIDSSTFVSLSSGHVHHQRDFPGLFGKKQVCRDDQDQTTGIHWGGGGRRQLHLRVRVPQGRHQERQPLPRQPLRVRSLQVSLRRAHKKKHQPLPLTSALMIDGRRWSSGAKRDAWAATASAAATTCPRRTWTETAARTTARTSAATTGSACAACASAKPEITPRSGTAAASASATTSAATVTTTNCVEVSVTRGKKNKTKKTFF